MLLMTKEIAAKIPKLYSQESLGENAIVHVKFFNPCGSWTWYATEFDGKDLFYGLVDGFEQEFGNFSLSELQSVRGPLGLGIERDLHFTPQPVKNFVK